MGAAEFSVPAQHCHGTTYQGTERATETSRSGTRAKRRRAEHRGAERPRCAPGRAGARPHPPAPRHRWGRRRVGTPAPRHREASGARHRRARRSMRLAAGDAPCGPTRMAAECRDAETPRRRDAETPRRQYRLPRIPVSDGCQGAQQQEPGFPAVTIALSAKYVELFVFLQWRTFHGRDAGEGRNDAASKWAATSELHQSLQPNNRGSKETSTSAANRRSIVGTRANHVDGAKPSGAPISRRERSVPPGRAGLFPLHARPGTSGAQSATSARTKCAAVTQWRAEILSVS